SAFAFAGGSQAPPLCGWAGLDEVVAVFCARAQGGAGGVVFPPALPATVLADVARWPAVRAVEGRLDLPARLGFGGASRQVVLIGLPADGTLQRLLDPDLEPTAVPADGLALSRRLAAILGVRPGDRVTVSPLVGQSFEVPVRALVEQYI